MQEWTVVERAQEKSVDIVERANINQLLKQYEACPGLSSCELMREGGRSNGFAGVCQSDGY